MKSLIELKTIIEKMNKKNQLQILKIFHDNNCEMTENSNGVFINLIYIKQDILNEINSYIEYLQLQEINLSAVEKIKNNIKKEYIFN